MKQFFFLLISFFTLSCKHKKPTEKLQEFDSSLKYLPEDIFKKEEKQLKKETQSSNEEDLPYYTVDDSGYFRDSGYFGGTRSQKINYHEELNHSMLANFLSKNLSTKSVLFLNKYSLSHSAFINKKEKVRFDTLRNTDVTIISRYNFGNKPSQIIFINGTIAGKYQEGQNNETIHRVLNLRESSFRRFLFKGKQFYFINASIMDCGATSGCLPIIYLLYDVKNKKLSEFYTFRVDDAEFFGDINGDSELDYIDIDNDGGYGILPTVNHYKIAIYSCNRFGQFKKLKDKKNKEYFIKGNSGNDYYVGEEMYIDKYYWPRKLK